MSFIPLQKTHIEALHAECSIYEHRATGCRIVHIRNEDPENLFAYMFRTPPHDSSGLPHILEHTVLCGSRRFPLKDPFAHLAKTSLKTFINAMTYSDRTLYPASSSVEKDLFNIMKVYGDAVFFPLLRKEIFRQEGVGILFDAEGNARFQGVVYNEMKGVYSNKESIIGRACEQSLFDTGPYSHDSGGNPSKIASLRYDNFVDFHRRCYHPSNACIFLYGNIETDHYLSFLEHNVLSSFVRGQPIKLSNPSPKRSSPRVYEVSYPAQSDQQLHSVIKNWLLPTTINSLERDKAHLVSELLIGNATSPLYRAMMESGLGKAVSAATGLTGDMYESMFTVGLDEVSEEKFDAVLKCIDAALRKIRDKGFDADHIDSIMAHIELQDREVRGGSAEGLYLMEKVAYAWAYSADILPLLETNKRIEALRGELKQKPRLLQDWITEHLIENTHAGIVYCRADTQKIQQDVQEEQLQLDTILREKESEFQEDARALFALQNASESKRNLKKMPRLQRSDVPTEIHRFLHSQEDTPCWTMRQHLFSNGITYVCIGFNASDIPLRLLLHLPLLSAIFTECGTRSHSPEALTRSIDRYSTGIYTGISCDMHAGTRDICPSFFVNIGFLASEAERATGLLEELFSGIAVHRHDRIRETMQEMISGFISSLIRHGHIHSLYHANRFLSPVAELEERWHSLTQLDHLQSYQNDSALLEKELVELQQLLFTQSRMKLSLVHEEQYDRPMQKFVERISACLAKETPIPQETLFKHQVQYGKTEILEVPAQVSFNALSFRGISHQDPLYAASLVLSQLLSMGYLWEHVRMRKGAYGAFAIPKGIETIFSLLSYRDPEIDDTFTIFNEALAHFANTPLDAQEIDQALFGILGSELQTIPPHRAVGVAFRYVLRGISDEYRQQVRDSILSVKAQDVTRAAAQLHSAAKNANRAVISGTELLDKSSLQNMSRIAVPL